MNINKENLFASSEINEYMDTCIKLVEYVADYSQCRDVVGLEKDMEETRKAMLQTASEIRSILTRANREALVCEGVEESGLPEVIWAVLEQMQVFAQDAMRDIGTWLYECEQE